jgi:uncharacterized membrane protein
MIWFRVVTDAATQLDGAAGASEHPRPAGVARWPGLGQRLSRLLGLVLIAALLPLHRFWSADLMLVALVLTVPGLVLTDLFGLPAESIRRFPLYVVPASLLVLIVSGALTDLVGPHLGVNRPLSGQATAIVTLALSFALWLGGIRTRVRAAPRLSDLIRPDILATLLLPALAAAGALLLNNGDGTVVAEVTAFAIPAAVGLLLLRAERLTHTQISAVIFSCALAMSWSFTLRSQGIIGFDISTELEIAKQTHHLGIWHVTHHNDPYGAMLSLTVLPSVLEALTGLSPLLCFKVLYPVFASLLPVAIYLLAAAHVRRRYACAAAMLLLVQDYFFEQLTELARQEVGLLFFAALIAAILDRDLRRGQAYLLTLAMGAGLVVSHYSSDYVAIILMMAAFASALCVDAVRRRLSDFTRKTLVALLVVAAGAAVWYGPVTHSAQNLSSFTTSLQHDGLGLFPSNGGLLHSFLNGTVQTGVTPTRYEHLAVRNYRPRAAYVHPLRQAFEPRFHLRALVSQPVHIRSATATSTLTVFGALFGELMLLGAGIGTVLLVIRRRRETSNLALMGIGTFVMLFFFRFSTTLASAYNQTRVTIQALVVVAVPAALLAQSLDRGWITRLRLRRLVGLAIPLMLAYQNSATTVLTGGVGRLNISQSGPDYNSFYTTPAELAAATWAYGKSHNALLYADRYAQLRLSTAVGADALSQVTPETLDRHAWVYGSSTNVVLGEALGVVASYSAAYQWPNRFLDRYFDTMFSDGESRVYHR